MLARVVVTAKKAPLAMVSGPDAQLAPGTGAANARTRLGRGSMVVVHNWL